MIGVLDLNKILHKDWAEPAHIAVKINHGLIDIYKAIRAKQTIIDSAFDRISEEIGFVVTTTIPIKVEVRNAKDVEMGMVNKLQGSNVAICARLDEKVERTPFKNLGTVLKEISFPNVHMVAGTYRVYLIWYAALRLKLRIDWVEPGHFLRDIFTGLDQGSDTINMEDAMTISAIDEVYPELRLFERISADRLAIQGSSKAG